MKTRFQPTVVALISLVVVQISCSLLGTTPETSTESENVPPYSGVFLKETNLFVEIPLSEGMPENSDSENIPTSSSSNPEIVVWQSNVNLDYLYVREYGLSGDQIDISFSQVEEGTLTITFSASLEPGTYCLIQGDPLGSPYSLPTWCFQLGGAESVNTIPTQLLNYRLVTEIAIDSNVGNNASEIEWSPDGNHIVIFNAWGEGVSLLYEVKSQNFETIGDGLHLFDVTWSPDGTLIAYVDNSSTINIVDVYSNEIVQSYTDVQAENGGYGLIDIDWNPDGKTIASITKTGTIKVFDFMNGNEVVSFSYYSDDLKHITNFYLDWSPDGKKLAVGNESNLQENYVQIWDAQNGSLLNEFNINRILNRDLLGIEQLAWSPDGVTFAAGEGSFVALINTETGKSVVIDPDTGYASKVSWQPSGKLVVLSNHSGITVWDTEGKLAANLDVGSFDGLAWSHDGQYLATTIMSPDGDTLRIWKIDI